MSLIANLIYGTGMRINKCVQLRVKDIDFALNAVTVRHGKGERDRITLLPQRLVGPLQEHMVKVFALNRQDCLRGGGFAP